MWNDHDVHWWSLMYRLMYHEIPAHFGIGLELWGRYYRLRWFLLWQRHACIAVQSASCILQSALFFPLLAHVAHDCWNPKFTQFKLYSSLRHWNWHRSFFWRKQSHVQHVLPSNFPIASRSPCQAFANWYPILMPKLRCQRNWNIQMYPRLDSRCTV